MKVGKDAEEDDYSILEIRTQKQQLRIQKHMIVYDTMTLIRLEHSSLFWWHHNLTMYESAVVM